MNQEDCKFLTIELFGEKEWHELIYEEVSSTWWCECGRASCLPCDNRTFDNWNDFGDVWNKMKENGKLKDWCAWLWEKSNHILLLILMLDLCGNLHI
jgi:hypothetical protein